jgi:dihydrofolate reductase
MKISIIVAMDSKRGIGKNNQLMWHIPGELPRFKNITTGHPIIMGRKTFESIGKPLPNRYNVVITRDPKFKIQNLASQGQVLESCVVNSLEEALRQAQGKLGSDEVFVIGGGQIYQQAIAKADRLYLTLVEGDFGADTFFPDYSSFTKVISEENREEEGHKYKFLTLEK